MLDGVRERATGLGYSAGWSVVKSLPRGVSARAFRAAADAATVRNGGGARQLRRNLRRVVGPAMSELRMDALVGAALRSYSRYWLETFRLEAMDHAAVAESFDRNSRGLDLLDAGLAAGNGVVVALSHSGNWDASGIWCIERYGPLTTVAERLRPASVFDRFVAYRESIGMEVVALTGGERPPMAVLSDRLRDNGVVCLLADRDLSHHGIEVDFFGERTRMPAGPALLAATTGAQLIVAHSRFVGDDGWGHDLRGPVALPGERLRDRVVAATQTMADLFAEGIRGKPEDWHMLQRLWLADLPARPAPPVAAAPAGTTGR
ncbi:KDO2-lipid IV(A) lauroyltransferase [Jatrophihabitans endophyticus]|uniref:KDO2-lipid IV(A) lauroyltransferase n=1 Tax=Jatrophihabitans endophyticus TaxID=1206085 RepID=A0A1M5LHV9_9ACTN|nr:phosphatidylinositol mannoside acyltransferase [Jatrophihabitans endophyticus]SHG64510.1 KDO2-lipid IV(A) lauroyltransferase [Jatrophihabitans endophyticus]